MEIRKRELSLEQLAADPAHSRRLWIIASVTFLFAVAFVIRTAYANYTTDLNVVWGTFWDFRDGGYYSVRAVLDGIVPWDVNQYRAAYPVGQEFPLVPPTYLVAHAPFQIFGYTAASIVMFVLNVVGIVALTRWSMSLARFTTPPVLVVGLSALVIASTGGRNLLFSGQLALVFTAGAYLALTARSTRAGATGVFLAMIKPSFGVPIALYTAATNRYRSALQGAGLAAVVSAILMIPFVRWAGGIGPLVDILKENVENSADSIGIALETTTGRVDAPAAIARLSTVIPSSTVENLIIVLVSIFAALVLFRRRHIFASGTFNDAAIVLACLATVTGIYHSVYDLILLILPALLLTRRDFAGGSVATGLRLATLGAILVASFNPFKIDTIVDFLADSPRFVEILGPGITAGAVLVAFALAAIIVWQLPQQTKSSTIAASADMKGATT